mgnify:CR=1 FL=1
MSGRRCIGLRFALVASILAVGLPASGMTVRKISSAGGIGLAVAPDGDIWTTAGNRLHRVDPQTGELRASYVAAGPKEEVLGIEAARDGDLWYGIRSYETAVGPQSVGRITSAGVATSYPLAGTTGGQYRGSVLLATAADGTVWFTLQSPGGVGVIRPGSVPALVNGVEGGPIGVLVARDGMVWYAVQMAPDQPSRLERLSPISYPPQYPQQIPVPRRGDGSWGQP